MLEDHCSSEKSRGSEIDRRRVEMDINVYAVSVAPAQYVRIKLLPSFIWDAAVSFRILGLLYSKCHNILSKMSL